MIIETEKENLCRDMNSKALINTDKEALKRRMKERNNFLKIQNMENQINIVKNEILEIKELLKNCLEKG